jgi:hypothetical protein
VGDFNTPLSPIGHPDQKNQERNFRIEWHHRSNGPERYLQSVPPCNSTIYSSQKSMELSPWWTIY